MKLKSPNINKLLILYVLYPGQALALSTVIKRRNMLLNDDVPYKNFSKEFSLLYRDEYIDYLNGGRKQEDGKRYVVITEKGKGYYTGLCKEFESYFRTLDKIHTSIFNLAE